VTSTLPEVLARIQSLLPPAPESVSAALPASTSNFGSALELAGTSTASGAASASATLSGSASSFSGTINAAAERYGLDPALLQSVIQQESGFDPNATSSAGAQGLMQLMPQTAASLGVTNPYDPSQSIDAGARYLRGQLDEFGGNVPLALAAYNAGGGAVTRYGGIPPYAETQNYVQQVLSRYQQLVADRGAS
jgi:soluble lytic murein transglycosylase-like protein